MNFVKYTKIGYFEALNLLGAALKCSPLVTTRVRTLIWLLLIRALAAVFVTEIPPTTHHVIEVFV